MKQLEVVFALFVRTLFPCVFTTLLGVSLLGLSGLTEIPVNETPPPLKYKEPKIENLIYLGS